MLNELKTLSENIEILIKINQKYQKERYEIEKDLLQFQLHINSANSDIEDIKKEHVFLQKICDNLLTKINKAQSEINLIIKKYPSLSINLNKLCSKDIHN